MDASNASTSYQLRNERVEIALSRSPPWPERKVKWIYGSTGSSPWNLWILNHVKRMPMKSRWWTESADLTFLTVEGEMMENAWKYMEMTSWAATVAPGSGSRDSAAKAFDRARSVPLHPWSKWDCNVCNGEHTACWPANWRKKANYLGYDDNTMYQIQ